MDISNGFERPMGMISLRLGDFDRDHVDSYLHPRLYNDVEVQKSEILSTLTP